MAKYDWLDSTHPVYERWVERWKVNERRLRGGDSVLGELHPFDWEVAEGRKNYELRQREATYMNFAEMFLVAMSGHLLREAPMADDDLSFGTLGLVQRQEGQVDPTLAELIYFNVDNAGQDGSQWNPFWMGVWRRAAATGHRWLYVDAPPQPPGTVADQLRGGLRPWVVEYSPVKVPNWDVDAQGLRWAIVRTGTRRAVVNADGKLGGNKGERGYLLLVRAGVTELGTEFSDGGWFAFTAKKEPTGAFGDWGATGGEIPMCPLFYRRDYGLDSDKEEEIEPAMSLPGITELGQSAIGYMNLSSAADFDVWDSAKSMTWLRGVDVESYNLAMQKKQEGSRYVPLKPAAGGMSGQQIVPEVQDSGQSAQAVAATFEGALKRKREEAQWLAVREASAGLDTSAVRVEMGFIEGKSPLLALAASELEQAQNTVLRWLELRADRAVRPTAVVAWTRTFDLTDTMDSIKKVFSLEQQIGVSSPTLRGLAMHRAAKESGLVTDDDELAQIQQEYEASAQQKAEADAQARDTAGAFGLTA